MCSSDLIPERARVPVLSLRLLQRDHRGTHDAASGRKEALPGLLERV